jgi:hypothetical protein
LRSHQNRTTVDSAREVHISGDPAGDVFLTTPQDVADESEPAISIGVSFESAAAAFSAALDDPSAGSGDDDDSPPPRGRVTETTEGVEILNFKDHFRVDQIPVFTEPSMLAAMERLVIEPRDLLRPQESDLAGLPNVPKVCARATGILLKRRAMLIQQIVAEREAVFQEEWRSRCSESARLSEDDSFRDDAAVREAAIERMQQWEIEQLILAERVREQTLREEEEMCERREMHRRELAHEVRLKQAVDASGGARRTRQ